MGRRKNWQVTVLQSRSEIDMCSVTLWNSPTILCPPTPLIYLVSASKGFGCKPAPVDFVLILRWTSRWRALTPSFLSPRSVQFHDCRSVEPFFPKQTFLSTGGFVLDSVCGRQAPPSLSGNTFRITLAEPNAESQRAYIWHDYGLSSLWDAWYSITILSWPFLFAVQPTTSVDFRFPYDEKQFKKWNASAMSVRYYRGSHNQ